ncbi:GGDEF domain-containing protein [Coralloluteibacterium stylophorae]|uniref:diguanylate cyclase n=1 Tax=Coralloluteibacterium stylophorae TaxID=1776034 RepID=A0A8J8AWR7_9GAMM|nr:GGDEF domain-containing protein [Coralloluteibacterium stylophorae]MBS7456991.1 diguanylate cyclase [Coralloluteibacterium stylophorae]
MSERERIDGGLRGLWPRRRAADAAPALAGTALAATGAPAGPRTPPASLAELFAAAGTPDRLLTAFADGLLGLDGELADMGRRLRRSAIDEDWTGYGRGLRQLIDKYISTIVSTAPGTPEDAEATLLRDLLRRILAMALGPLLQPAPDLAEEAQALADILKHWAGEADAETYARRLKQLCHRVSMRADEAAEQQRLILGLFDLLLENVTELLDDSSWLHGQIAIVRELISGPIDRLSVEDARSSLREVIYRQGLLKQSMAESKDAMKEMMVTFVDRLNGMAASTGEFHDRIEGYSQAIRGARSIGELNRVLDDVLAETGRAQEQALRARDRMLEARQEVEAAEQRILRLEQQLQDASGQARADQLTGVLNRRGFEELYEREAARAERSGAPLCVALVDLDDFRRLNETHGHLGGDAALRHFAELVRTVLRGSDALARFGGEEFLLLMPDTTLYEASAAVARAQQALVGRPLLHEEARIVLSFSGGVAQRAPSETRDVLLKRADGAMYQAKKGGKNRVVAAK